MNDLLYAIDIIQFLKKRLAAYEGGAPSVHISYDDATYNYVISQKTRFDNKADNEILGCSRSLTKAFELAITEKVYE